MVDDERWKARFRAARVSLPSWARNAPHRSMYRSNATGTWEIYTWDRDTGEQRQVTDRPNGTWMAGVDPSGEWIWWFADTDGDEFGVWHRTPFGGGESSPAVPGLEPSFPSGLALGTGGVAVIGRSTESGSSLHLCRPDAASTPETLYEHTEDAHVAALSRDESLIAIGHSEHGDSRHMALRVVRQDGTTVADLWDGPGKGVYGDAFAPVEGDSRLLVGHERRGKDELLIWDPVKGTEQEIVLDLPGEVGARWYTDGSALLISHSYEARDELYRYDLAAGSLTRIDTPRGVIGGAAPRPDGTVEYSWSSAAEPPAIRSTTGEVVLTPPGPAAPPSVPVEDAWVDGPGGRIHALIRRPATGSAPFPTVFDVHGGPTAQDEDSFVASTAAWVDHGFAVVQVNYRGSTGYGSQWRDANEGRVGLTEVEDVTAVRDWAVESGLADPDRLVLTGGSWGGYLALLGIGTRPDDWTVAVAAVPVADYVAAYEDEMEGLQAFDRSLFGGSPAEVPDRYRESSPLTYVDQVTVPVLILAGENDPRCPIRQIDNYLDRLAALGVPHEVYRYDAGHGSLVVEERIKQMETELTFALKYLGMS
ncbi:prolyl oligopeptidase family serine peptidase [Spirillospora sp. NPDC047279]|uniref:S9 family peptidase n=1 Tax=Spirillospora sp. NPDC047279 TaxID=3155478 RepID=UPI0033F9EB17